jgi:hypothetical protein
MKFLLFVLQRLCSNNIFLPESKPAKGDLNEAPA